MGRRHLQDQDPDGQVRHPDQQDLAQHRAVHDQHRHHARRHRVPHRRARRDRERHRPTASRSRAAGGLTRHTSRVDDLIDGPPLPNFSASIPRSSPMMRRRPRGISGRRTSWPTTIEHRARGAERQTLLEQRSRAGGSMSPRPSSRRTRRDSRCSSRPGHQPRDHRVPARARRQGDPRFRSFQGSARLREARSGSTGESAGLRHDTKGPDDMGGTRPAGATVNNGAEEGGQAAHRRPTAGQATQGAARRLRCAAVLLPQHRAGLLHQRDAVQPARHGRVGPWLHVHQRDRLLRRAAPERVRPARDRARALGVDRGHQQLPAVPQGRRELIRSAARRQGRLPDVRREDRGALQEARPRGLFPEARRCAPDRRQGRDDAHRRSRGRALRAQRARRRSTRTRRCARSARNWARISSSRPPTATPGTPRSSSPSEADFEKHADEITGGPRGQGHEADPLPRARRSRPA
jgi:hypothetical protein